MATAKAKYKDWRRWATIWIWANILLGGGATVLGAATALNSKSAFLTPLQAIVIAVLTPFLTFVLTLLKPAAEAGALKIAYRELEKALTDYEASANPSNDILTDAIKKGLDTLGKA